MIDPRYQWCQQIDITNDCPRNCSNCTRLVGHTEEPFYMSVDQFVNAVDALKHFPELSPSTVIAKYNVVGIMGGEPLIHPNFAEMVRILAKAIPNPHNRGLWTGLDWQKTSHAKLIEETFAYVHNNQHTTECKHSPVLVAVVDVIKDPQKQRQVINNCWLQRKWASSITPKGYFFCEVAGAMDQVFDGPGGLPVEPGCWRRPLADFQEQVDRWCYRCGVPLNLEGRKDSDSVDDISSTNLKDLQNSPKVLKGKYVLFTGEGKQTSEPWRYLR